MKSTKILMGVSVFAMLMGVVACGGAKQKSETAKAVEAASQMTLDELKEASKKEFQDNPNGVFKVVGLTSVLRTVMKAIAAEYDWITYEASKDDKEQVAGDNCFVKNDYKDQALLVALKEAETKYVADYALVQDARSFATYLEDGILHNYVPSDVESEFHMAKDDQMPLRGIWFNKVFWTNTNYEACGGKPITNIWQFAGTKEDANHISEISFQSPATEAINMSFLCSVMAPANEARLKEAYKDYYGKDWAKSANYSSIGEQWVMQFASNISIFHSSDGTCMKETQLKDKWNVPIVYYGAFSKMKDAVGKKYDVDLNGNGTIEETLAEPLKVTCGGVEYTYTSEKDVNAMTTVKWDYNIKGFNGFIYSMDSEIVEHAEFPYTACLFARTLLKEDVYRSAITNKSTPTADGKNGNQYGYYYPAQEGADFPYAKGDWTKAKHLEVELIEDYGYLSNVKGSVVNKILAQIAGNGNAPAA